MAVVKVGQNAAEVSSGAPRNCPTLSRAPVLLILADLRFLVLRKSKLAQYFYSVVCITYFSDKFSGTMYK